MSFDERRYIEAIPPQLFDEMISEYEATLPPKNHQMRQQIEIYQ
jgi:hypothetical protein